MTATLPDLERAFVNAHPVARLATADTEGIPHAVPICFVVIDETLYVTIDLKPKQDARRLKRLRNIADNKHVAVIIDRYDDDWSRLGWVLLRGAAEILEDGPEHAAAQAALKARYTQYRDMDIASMPVIAVRIARVTSWGELD